MSEEQAAWAGDGRERWLPGLSTSAIKWIALFFMTLDHIAAFGFEIPIVGRFYNPLRLVGRIAAPLFLFALVQGLRHTSNRPRFLLRLYLAGVGAGLFVAVTDLLFGEIVGYITPGNIIFTFFYVALYSWAVEGLMDAARKRNWRGADCPGVGGPVLRAAVFDPAPALGPVGAAPHGGRFGGGVPGAQPHRQLSAHPYQRGLWVGDDSPWRDALLCQNKAAAVRGVRRVLPGMYGRGGGGRVLLSHPGLFIVHDDIF